MTSQIIAHRGESYEAPENTLASINLAWKNGADAVEVDVHLSKDNHVVVFHDKTLKRVGGISKKVKCLTLAELKKIDVGSWKNKIFKNEKIPTLKEVLETIPNNKKLIVEIKSDYKILPFLRKDIGSLKLTNEQIEIISFKYDVVSKAKELFPNKKIFYIANLDYNLFTKLICPSVKTVILKAKRANLDGLNVWAGKILTEDFIKNVKSANLLLYTWTVDDSEKIKKLISLGVDGIITNKVSFLKKLLIK